MVVDAVAPMRRLMTELLTDMVVKRVRAEASCEDALVRLGAAGVDAVIADCEADAMDGAEFVRQLRNAFLDRRRYLPVLLAMGQPTAARICAARDAGVNEIIVKPLTAARLRAELALVVREARPFVESPTYFGPDRRRGQRPEHRGPFRRLSDRRQRADIFV